jgi:hypothetical protein
MRTLTSTQTLSKTGELESVSGGPTSVSSEVESLRRYSDSKTIEAEAKQKAPEESTLVWMISVVALMLLTVVLYAFLMMKENYWQREPKKPGSVKVKGGTIIQIPIP